MSKESNLVFVKNTHKAEVGIIIKGKRLGYGDIAEFDKDCLSKILLKTKCLTILTAEEAQKEKEEAESEKVDQEIIELIVEAIGELDPEDGFTESGVPRVNALEEIVGFDITAEDRDEAWELYNANEDSE